MELGGVCGAEHRLGYLITPDGLLFKCWAQASLGPENSTGNILDDHVTPRQEENLRCFLDWNPLEDAKCKECRVLPVCMGGCPYLRLNGFLGEHCSPWRDFLLDTLELRYKMTRLMKEQTESFQNEDGA